MATYTSAATGLWSAGATWVGGVKPPSGAGHKIIIAASHVVTYDEAAGTYGDDTSSATAANNAIYIQVGGTLKASRAVSTSLTCRGTLYFDGVLDWGSTADPIPSGVTAELKINDSAALSAGKHGLVTVNTAGAASLRARGEVRRRNTTLTASVGAGGTSITVDDSTGWQVGDALVLESDTADVTRAQVVTITGGASPTWSVSAITLARSAGTLIGNLTSNVVIRSMSAAAPGVVSFSTAAANTTAALDFGDLLLEDVGSTNGWVGVNTSQQMTGSFGMSAQLVPSSSVSVSRVAIRVTNAANSAKGLALSSLSLDRFAFDEIALYAPVGGMSPWTATQGTRADIDMVVYRAPFGSTSQVGEGANDVVATGAIRGNDLAFLYVPSLSTEFVDYSIRLPASKEAFSIGTGLAVFRRGDIDAGYIAKTNAAASNGKLRLIGTSFSAAALAGGLRAFGSAASRDALVTLESVNGDPADNRAIGHYQYAQTDSAVRSRGTTSVKIAPRVASALGIYECSVPGLAGVAMTIRGSLRFDATYGTATPPRIDLSGQGVTGAFTAPATANTWHDWSFTVTPSTTGDITVTVTVQSTSTTGFAWLDGLYHYPMIQSVRHYGYQWLPQAAQIADARLTITEAAALALPVAVDHGAETITVTGALTNAEVFQACIADLCQTANQSQALHITSADGADFETTYTVVLSGAGAVSGLYTDAAGRHVAITAPALISGSRVQLYNVTTATELYNGVLSGVGLTAAATWTVDQTIRLRADHNTKVALQTVGLLTSAGLSFLDIQAEDTVYAALGIDGATVTEFVADEPNIQVDATDSDGYTEWGRLYAWWQNYQTTSAGIAGSLFGRFTSSDGRTFNLDQTGPDITIRNNNTAALLIGGGSLNTSDGLLPFDTSAGAGAIFGEFGRSYTAIDTAAQIGDLAKVHGLVAGTPLVVTPTSRTAGSVVQTFTDASGTVTVERV